VAPHPIQRWKPHPPASLIALAASLSSQQILCRALHTYGTNSHQKNCDPKRFRPLDDMVMKMLALGLPFVDVPYAKFYALGMSYCVWDPSAIAPLQDLTPSILPELSRG
jgi:hypothetical protein